MSTASTATEMARKESYLSPAQLARVEALTASRKAQHRSEGFVTGRGPDARDLVAVARFILDGQEPWTDTRGGSS